MKAQIVMGPRPSAAAPYSGHGRGHMRLIGDVDPSGPSHPWNVAGIGSLYHNCATGTLWRRSVSGWDEITPASVVEETPVARRKPKRRRKRS